MSKRYVMYGELMSILDYYTRGPIDPLLERVIRQIRKKVAKIAKRSSDE